MADDDVELMDPRIYVHLAATIRKQIGDGTLQPGSLAPSITTLAGTYGHARQTCVKALHLLEGEGLLVNIPGLGFYVS
jgi:DNA-binding GntR family transcriptional regulator